MSIQRKIKTAVLVYQNHGLKNFFKLSISKILNYEVDLSNDEDDKFSFYNHAKALNYIYDKADSFTIGKISDSILAELEKLIKAVGDETVKTLQLT
jgi:hypothetical protein